MALYITWKGLAFLDVLTQAAENIGTGDHMETINTICKTSISAKMGRGQKMILMISRKPWNWLWNQYSGIGDSRNPKTSGRRLVGNHGFMLGDTESPIGESPMGETPMGESPYGGIPHDSPMGNSPMGDSPWRNSPWGIPPQEYYDDLYGTNLERPTSTRCKLWRQYHVEYSQGDPIGGKNDKMPKLL